MTFKESQCSLSVFNQVTVSSHDKEKISWELIGAETAEKAGGYPLHSR